MSRNSIRIDATPDGVYDVLADPRTYAHWVTGTHRVRAADADWPQPGATLEHETGLPPLLIRDTTTVVAASPPDSLVLRARAGPLPDAVVTLRLRPDGDGTRVTMIEDPANPLLRLLTGPLGHALLRVRNAESLRRLKALAEGTTPRPQAPLPAR